MADLTLVTVGPAWGLPFQSSAPFPVKLECWLRLAGIPYQGHIENNPGKGPKKKTPWIVTAEGAMGDSELIIEWLKKTRQVDPDRANRFDDVVGAGHQRGIGLAELLVGTDRQR